MTRIRAIATPARRILKATQRSLRKRGWGIHIDHPWAEDVRKYGAPFRAYIQTPLGWLIVGEKSQVYDRKTKTYTNRWAHIVYHPPRN